MKIYILIILLITSKYSFGQLADTTWARSVTMTAGDWAYLTGKSLSKDADSVMIVALRKVRTVVQLQSPSNFNTNVTVDSISALAMLEWYKIILFAPFIETMGRGSNIRTAIIGETNLTPFIEQIDGSLGNMFIRERTRGKNYLLDTN